MFDDTLYFLRDALWKTPLDQMSKRRGFFIKSLRILVLTFRGFFNKQYELEACALTHYTLLCIAPLLAICLGIARGFGFEESLHKLLLERLSGQKVLANQIIKLATAFLEQAKESVITGLGIILLLWSTLRILKSIESAFNTIWDIQEKRKIGRQFSGYFAFLLLGPLFLGISSGISVYLRSQAEAMSQVSLIGTLLYFVIKLFPFFLTSTLLAFLYIFTPNTKVKFSAGIIAAMAAGSLYHLARWLYFLSQASVSQYNAIYGSFAAFPLLLLWVFFSWLIVLMGAKMAYAIQNADAYEFEEEKVATSSSFKKSLALAIAHQCIRQFALGKSALTLVELTNELKTPIGLTKEILETLVEAKILIKVKLPFEEHAWGFQPAKNIEKLTVHHTLDALDKLGTEAIPVKRSQEWEKIKEVLTTFDKQLESSKANLLLKDL